MRANSFVLAGVTACIGVLIPVTRLDNWLAGSGNSGSAAPRDCC